MLDAKLVEVLTSPPDGALPIVTEGQDGPHLANTWRSYVTLTEDDKFLIPVAGMKHVEENLKVNKKIQVSVTNREVEGKMYKGAGFIVKGYGAIKNDGPEYELVKNKFPWCRAVLIITIKDYFQTL